MQRTSQPLSDLEIDERAAAASAVLNDPYIGEAFTALREMYVDILEGAPVGSEAAVSAHTCLKVLQDFRSSLQSMITDKQMRTKYSGRVKNG